MRQITAELPAGTRPDRWSSLSCFLLWTQHEHFDSELQIPTTFHSRLTIETLQIRWSDVQSGKARGRWFWTSSSAAHHRGGGLQEEEARERGGEVRFQEVTCFDLNFSTLGWPGKLPRATRRIYQSSTIWWRSYLFTMNRERSIGTSSSWRDNELFFVFWLLKIIKYSVMICRFRVWEFYTGWFFNWVPIESLDVLASLDFKLSVTEWVSNICFSASASTGLLELLLYFLFLASFLSSPDNRGNRNE